MALSAILGCARVCVCVYARRYLDNMLITRRRVLYDRYIVLDIVIIVSLLCSHNATS